MKCSNCDSPLTRADITCPSCGKINARTKEDLRKTDPQITKGVAWALIAMGLMGLGFVIANSWTDWYSGLDYVGPVALLLIGGLGLFSANRQAKR